MQTDQKQYLIEEPKFQLLKQCQKEIFEATQVSPSIRKLINELIKEANLEPIKFKFIEICKN